MDRHWANATIEELRALDREEAPHGLYGLREAYQTKTWLPKLSAVLNEPRVQFARRLGGASPPTRFHGDALSLELPGQSVELKLRDYADTKVRKFGSAYRLDNASRVHHESPSLPRELPKLAKRAREARKPSSIARSFGYLLIGYFRRERDGVELCHQATSPAFLERYGLAYIAESWPDIHGRDFQVMMSLWHVDQPPAHSQAS